ncbi:MAG: D-tyrosyl-tRNA(Tyr) deacylase [Deltaproteobacteria bacterium CG_4_10_14_3_um_filter_60_8]|nr:MAG: D-tyrosyl-tRNA(Tyr) deacylase [Desulfobacterales bacterium CG2_30_60_27]PIP43771.1 MAG: D-tyrosyl-tRNA(Tyr) deacylase [Deltaproteobacteria bacterium CG23_combo_of_CG06-09_8_20_14_all_60_8]PIY22514.1 MAG: D-tyrosyl-tRNA(Tyr) deacylase [Deltaproteobacteria bacterium CG_4_10_14_3_um_filter_60_8]
MRAVVQRVSRAQVSVAGQCSGQIGPGLLVLLGVHRDDLEQDAVALADKIANLRVFEDKAGIMNLSLIETGGAMLVVSQFTLYGDCRKGRRPSYSTAAPPEAANRLYEIFVSAVRQQGITVETGQFQAMMEVELVNSGPATLLLDSTRLF